MTISPPLRIGIVGAGPGGLATAINLLRLDNVQVSVFDQARVLREVGAGISINQNTWRLLQGLGAADQIDAYFTRGVDGKADTEHRNGLNGDLLVRKTQSEDPDKPPRSRIERYKLQNALLSRLPSDLIQLGKKLASISEDSTGVTLTFDDGTAEGPFDLIIGADGIRSVVRQHVFPTHQLKYTGKVAYRVIIPQSKVAHIKGIPEGACFWHTPTTHVYTNPLENGLFEIATRASESEEHGAKVSWGQKVPKDQVVHHYDGYCETIRQVIAAPDEWLEFAMFGGPRLDSVVHNGRIALIGDASHPLSGAFGSGAAFAFEDAYVLSQAIAHVQGINQGLEKALEMFDQVRRPRYKGLYEILDGGIDTVRQVSAKNLESNAHVHEVVSRIWSGGEEGGWIYGYNVNEVWKEFLDKEKAGPGSGKTRLAVAPALAVPVAA